MFGAPWLALESAGVDAIVELPPGDRSWNFPHYAAHVAPKAAGERVQRLRATTRRSSAIAHGHLSALQAGASGRIGMRSIDRCLGTRWSSSCDASAHETRCQRRSLGDVCRDGCRPCDASGPRITLPGQRQPSGWISIA